MNLTATLDAEAAYKDADFVVIAAPTNYDSKKNFFDTSAVESVIELVIQVQSGCSYGHQVYNSGWLTPQVCVQNMHCDNIIFSPEFLRESKALYDNLYPVQNHCGNRCGECTSGKSGSIHLPGLLQEGAIKEEYRYPDHGIHRGGGCQVICQYISGSACHLISMSWILMRR